ncbi:MAG: hypothetical protein ACRECF_10860, partial [Methyloceanibacter sp.]
LTAALALFISVTTMWLTLLRRGTIGMTQPTVIFFGPDGGKRGLPKIFLRTLLYSSAKRGQLLESLYVRLSRGETKQNFNILVYGDHQLARGSGLFVGEEGIAANHHFLLPADGTNYEFKAGDYGLEVYARLLGSVHAKCLAKVHLSLSHEDAEKLKEDSNGAYFDWEPDAQKYHVHIEQRTIPASNSREALIEQLLLFAEMQSTQPLNPGLPQTDSTELLREGRAR